MKGRSASKIKLTSYDELLGGGEETNDIQQVSLEHLHSFENHPFQVNDDEAMAELVESVKEEGILTALLVRPLGDGEYEIIAGHRRRHAAQLAGLKEVPVIIRNMDQDTAVRAMVDSNLQRPNILPSEKAFAYRMKMEAMNHQGTSGGISAKDIGKNANDSARQVYRYIRLTYLMNDLLNAVDRDVIGLQVGVELVLVFLVGLSAGFCYLIAGISVVTEVLSIGFGISTDWTMKSAIITTVVFVLLPHIGMGIVAVIEVVKCGLQEFIFG